jgi:hypothetical protein
MSNADRKTDRESQTIGVVLFREPIKIHFDDAVPSESHAGMLQAWHVKTTHEYSETVHSLSDDNHVYPTRRLPRCRAVISNFAPQKMTTRWNTTVCATFFGLSCFVYHRFRQHSECVRGAGVLYDCEEILLPSAVICQFFVR